MSETGRRPAARDPVVRARMARQSSRDTYPELLLRSEMHSLGLRYFVDRRPLPSLRRRADVVFPRARLAVYMDGCFWHGCPEHASWPAHNAAWWREKIRGNQERDRDTDRRLEAAGWSVLRFWEHDDPREAARLVAEAVTRLRRRS